MAAGAGCGLHGAAGAPPQRPACTEAGVAGMGLHYAALNARPEADVKPPDLGAEAAGAGAGAHYAALGVGPDASREHLRAAYRAAVLRLHPDKAAAAGGGGAAARFQDVQLAWEVRSQQCALRLRTAGQGLWEGVLGRQRELACKVLDSACADVQFSMRALLT